MIKLEGIRAIDCDLDGTLVSRANQVLLDGVDYGLASQGRRHGREILVEMMKPEWGSDDEKIFADLIPDDTDKAKAARQTYLEYVLKKYPSQAKPIKRARETIAQLRGGGYIVGITTGLRPELVEKIRRKLGEFDIVKTIYDPEDEDLMVRSKLNPAFTPGVLDIPGVAAKETIGVGDSASDMEMYHNAGVIAVGVLSGNFRNRKQALAAGAEFVLSNVTDLKNCLPSQVRPTVGA